MAYVIKFIIAIIVLYWFGEIGGACLQGIFISLWFILTAIESTHIALKNQIESLSRKLEYLQEEISELRRK